MKNLASDLYAFSLKFLAMALVVTLPVRHALIAAGVLIVADFITGIWASIKEKKPITSTGFRRSVNKLFAYETAILIAFLMEQYLLSGLPVVKVITGLIGLTEGKSFFENIRRITGLDIWAQIISKINMEDVKNLDKKEDQL